MGSLLVSLDSSETRFEQESVRRSPPPFRFCIVDGVVEYILRLQTMERALSSGEERPTEFELARRAHPPVHGGVGSGKVQSSQIARVSGVCRERRRVARRGIIPVHPTLEIPLRLRLEVRIAQRRRVTIVEGQCKWGCETRIPRRLAASRSVAARWGNANLSHSTTRCSSTVMAIGDPFIHDRRLEMIPVLRLGGPGR